MFKTLTLKEHLAEFLVFLYSRLKLCVKSAAGEEKLFSMFFFSLFLGNKNKRKMRFIVRRYNSVPDADDDKAHSPDTQSENESYQRLSRSASPTDPTVKQNGGPPSQSSSKETCPSTETSVQTPQVSSVDKLISPVARRGRAFAERQTTRLVSKVGESYISNQNITGKKSKFVMDIFTTLLDLRWRYCILVFALAFLLSWLLFALIYYIIAIIHEDHKHIDDPDWKPCHTNVYDFTTAFLFSLETQHTIGYGFRAMEPNCPTAVITLCAQSCIGVFFQCIVTGLIFAKLSRPKRRAETIMFSEKGVIVQRDDQLHLLFRVGDMRKSYIIGTSIRAVMVKNRLTKEGELIPLCQYPLTLETESSIAGDSFVFLVWPVTVAHRIDKKSPLWNISAEQILSERFEIIVILEGTVESTGMATQVRTSYLPSEILWGHRLAPLLTYKKETGGYKIDHQQFHATIPVNMPECSARELAERSRTSSAKDNELEKDYPINFTAPASNYAHQRASMSSAGGGPLRRLRNSLKRRRNSELPVIPQAANQQLPPDEGQGSKVSVTEEKKTGSQPLTSAHEPPAYEDEPHHPREPTTSDFQKEASLKKCHSENGIVHMSKLPANGTRVLPDQYVEATSC